MNTSRELGFLRYVKSVIKTIHIKADLAIQNFKGNARNDKETGV